MIKLNKVYNEDCRETMKRMDDKSINMVMTSPPYWALRDYGKVTERIWDGKKDCNHRFVDKKIIWHQDRGGGNKKEVFDDTFQHKGSNSGFCSKCGAWKGQLGLEPTFDLYIKHLCDVFDEVKRVLRDDGTIWINIADTYNSGGNYRVDNPEKDKNNKYFQKGSHKIEFGRVKVDPQKQGISAKSQCAIPERFVIEMLTGVGLKEIQLIGIN